MANANAIVEKMAGLGLRHGEKAGVAIAMMVFFLCVGMAVSQAHDRHVARAGEEGRAGVAEQPRPQGGARHDHQAARGDGEHQADQFRRKPSRSRSRSRSSPTSSSPKRDWVTPEPGAGLIRDTPELIAPTELYAYAGRGGLLVFALDEEGNKIKLKEGEEEEKRPQKLRQHQEPSQRGMGGGGMMGGRRRRKKKPSKSRPTSSARRRKSGRAGDESSRAGWSARPHTKEAERAEADKEEGGPFKEITKGYRWVAITGTLDHAQMLANYRDALKNPAIAHPQYLRLDLAAAGPCSRTAPGRTGRRSTRTRTSTSSTTPGTRRSWLPRTSCPTDWSTPCPSSTPGSGRRSTSPASCPRRRSSCPRSPRPGAAWDAAG